LVEKKSELRLFIDSAGVGDWEHYLPTGIFYGVTTNPKLLKQVGIEFTVGELSHLAGKAFELGANEIHLQVWGKQVETMLEVGKQLAEIDQRVSVKVPINLSGVCAAFKLIKGGANVTLTAVHSAQQILIAIALGAKYAAPYLGRMNDGGMDGVQEVSKMHQIVTSVSSPLRVLVASIRHTSELVTLASQGLDTFTILPPLIDELFLNELTEKAVKSFELD
jgi:transaldolase